MHPKYYANVCVPQPQCDYSEYQIKFGHQEDYFLVNESKCDKQTYNLLSSGNYGQVFEGVNAQTNETVAIKILKPNKSREIRRELLILETLHNNSNILNLIDVVHDPRPNALNSHFFEIYEDKEPALVFNYN